VAFCDGMASGRTSRRIRSPATRSTRLRRPAPASWPTLPYTSKPHTGTRTSKLASLLHEQVQWTGLCTNRGQVLDWYRGLLADGAVPSVESVEVDRDAVVLGLAVSRRAEGARPAPAQRLYQVFTVDRAQVIDIRGYPDRHSALTRNVADGAG